MMTYENMNLWKNANGGSPRWENKMNKAQVQQDDVRAVLEIVENEKRNAAATARALGLALLLAALSVGGMIGFVVGFLVGTFR